MPNGANSESRMTTVKGLFQACSRMYPARSMPRFEYA